METEPKRGRAGGLARGHDAEGDERVKRPREVIRDAIIAMVARRGVGMATLTVTVLAMCGSVAIMSVVDVFHEITGFGYFLAALCPALVAPIIAYVAFEGFAYVVHLQRELEGEVDRRLHAEDRLRELANTDDLTGVLNRRFFLERAQEEMHRARRYGGPLSVLILDLDHFKRVNDSHGHAAGDQALIELVEICRERVREHDLLARVGGEEFVVLMPSTKLDGALTLAERLRACLEQRPMTAGRSRFRLTMSAGVAELAGETDFAALLARADAALYQAKDAGRNRVVAAA